MLYDVIPSDDFWPPPMISDACRVPPMIPDAFRRWPEPRFKIFPISFRLPLSTNQKAARTMVTQVPPNAAFSQLLKNNNPAQVLLLDSANRLKVGHLFDNFFLSCWLKTSSLWAVPRSKTSHLGGKTSKFDTWNSDVWRHVKTCFARVHSRVDAIDGIQSRLFANFCLCL